MEELGVPRGCGGCQGQHRFHERVNRSWKGGFPPLNRGQDLGRRHKGKVRASPFSPRPLLGGQSCEQRHPLRDRQEQAAAPVLPCQDTGSPPSSARGGSEELGGATYRITGCWS